ncbi:hypothetical protein ABEB36_014074 [Hypothenemus hampei]|uniref:Uncharacterized protein n=1 Tax=Hypothenemus hampei TaxID=57062 RepID=A0ABD1E7T5_HYPHA
MYMQRDTSDKNDFLRKMISKFFVYNFNHPKILIGSGVIAILSGWQSIGRPYRSAKKRHYPLNRHSMKKMEAETSTSTKKLKRCDGFDFEINASFGYRLINFGSMFSAISEMVQYKKCDGDVNFTETSIRGLGFKLKDTRRILIANLRAQQDTKEARMLRRAAQKKSQDMATALEGLLYGPGIAD